MKKGMILVLTVAAAASQAQVLTQWDFNATGSSATSPAPSLGSGTASLIGGATSTGFNSGTGSSDPAVSGNVGWQTTTYPAQSTASGTAGVQFAVSTAGFLGVQVRFDTRHSNTSSRWVRFDYSTNGGSSWVNGTVAAGTIFSANGGDTWVNNRTVDLASAAEVSNNANFAFRMVSIFGPTVSEGAYIDGGNYGTYAPSNPNSTYAGGTLRWDMVTVSAQPVPEPGTIAALGLGAAALLRRRKK